MSELMRVATVAAAVLAAGAVGAGPARADHKMGGAGTAAAPCSPAGTALELTAAGHKFDKNCLAVTAGESFTIRFDNRDRDRHNVAILPSHTATDVLFAGDIIPGPKQVMYAVPSLKAGTYHFHCEVHPNLMNGTFVVAAPADVSGRAAAALAAAKTRHGQTAAPAPSAQPAAGAAGGSTGKDAAPAGTPSAQPATPAPATTGAPSSRVAAAAPAPAAAPAAAPLARTGSSDRLLVLLAGVALAAGGLSVLGGARAKA